MLKSSERRADSCADKMALRTAVMRGLYSGICFKIFSPASFSASLALPKNCSTMALTEAIWRS